MRAMIQARNSEGHRFSSHLLEHGNMSTTRNINSTVKAGLLLEENILLTAQALTASKVRNKLETFQLSISKSSLALA